MPRTLRRLLNRVRYRRFDVEIAEEIAFHRTMKQREGVTQVDREMGNELRMRELSREVWVRPSLDALLQDTRNALRVVTRRPAFSITVASVLSVGVTVSLVAFSLVDALLLRPLPVDRPDQLVYLRAPSFSFPIVREVRSRTAIFASSFAWNLEQYGVQWNDDLQPTLVMLASGQIYQTLGARPVLGRLLSASDEGTGEVDTQAIAVLSYGAWQARFAGDPGVIGRAVRVEEELVTIVGVTPPEFFGVSPGRSPELTMPVTLAPRLRARDRDVLMEPFASWLHFMGRLTDGVSITQADAAFQLAWRQALEATTPTSLAPERRARILARSTGLEPGAVGFSSVRNQFRQPVLVLAAFAALLLILTCATVANLLVASTWGRSREVVVRIALGCGRARLCRQLLIEGIGLAALAGLMALAAAPALSHTLVALVATPQAPVTLNWTADARLLTLVLSIIVVTALAFSMAPIVLAWRVDAGPMLKTGSHQPSSHGGVLGRSLVAAQVACSVVLLIGAGLFVRSLTQVLSIDPGFDSRQLLVAALPAAPDGRGLVDQLMATRGVRSAAFSLYPPVSDRDGSWTSSVGVDLQAPVEERQLTYFNAVSPAFFETLGTPLVAGRDFNWSDAQGNQRVAILNAAAAMRFFGGESPLGRRITVGLDPSRRDLTIVGVVGNAKYQRLQEEPREIVYLPYLQAGDAVTNRPIFATIRVASMSEENVSPLGRTMASLAPGHNVQVERVTDRIRESLVTERALAWVAVSLAACALLLSCVGVFGLMAHLVGRRTREIGVRMALGARASQVLRQVAGETLALSVVGLVIGTTIALGAVRWIQGLLHIVSPTDPTTYAAAALLTTGFSVLAGWIPARRAAAVDPATALRVD